jgi:D-alanine-D-alanine ligase
MAKVLLLHHEMFLFPLRRAFEAGRKAPSSVPFKCEQDVAFALRDAGHDVFFLGLADSLDPLIEAIKTNRPDVCFNLLEEFRSEALFDKNIVALLEMLGVPYTGCNSEGLYLARDKGLAKKILHYHGISSPGFQVFSQNSPNLPLEPLLQFPLIVKCLTEEASTGLSQASIVHTREKLEQRLQYIFKAFGCDAIVENFIEGREFFVAVSGHETPTVFPPRELKFMNQKNPGKSFFSHKAKFDVPYQKRNGILTAPARLTKAEEKILLKLAIETYGHLRLSGYARIDFRMNKEGRLFVIEANPNPDLSRNDDFALSAKQGRISYEELIDQIVTSATQWKSVLRFSRSA